VRSLFFVSSSCSFFSRRRLHIAPFLGKDMEHQASCHTAKDDCVGVELLLGFDPRAAVAMADNRAVQLWALRALEPHGGTVPADD
jgi:hypothetical protein